MKFDKDARGTADPLAIKRVRPQNSAENVVGISKALVGEGKRASDFALKGTSFAKSLLGGLAYLNTALWVSDVFVKACMEMLKASKFGQEVARAEGAATAITFALFGRNPNSARTYHTSHRYTVPFYEGVKGGINLMNKHDDPLSAEEFFVKTYLELAPKGQDTEESARSRWRYILHASGI